jgi:hypothetical protein
VRRHEGGGRGIIASTTTATTARLSHCFTATSASSLVLPRRRPVEQRQHATAATGRQHRVASINNRHGCMTAVVESR